MPILYEDLPLEVARKTIVYKSTPPSPAPAISAWLIIGGVVAILGLALITRPKK
jgi:hypothetical protein